MGTDSMVITGKDIQTKAAREIYDQLALCGFKRQVGQMETDLFYEIIAQSWNVYRKYVGILGLVKPEEEDGDERTEKCSGT